MKGMTMVEVLMASVVASIGLIGGLSLIHWSEQGRQAGVLGTRALALATSKVEVKRLASWERVLLDVSADGRSARMMVDNGVTPDAVADDGIFTASEEVDGIQLTWMVEPNRPERLSESSHMTIRAKASFVNRSGRTRTIEVGTIRGNPRYLGSS